MVTLGKGGWTWETVYNLPVPMRNMYMQMLSDQLALEAGKPAAGPTNGSGMHLKMPK